MALTYAGENYLESAREILFIQKNATRMMEDITDYIKGDITFGIGLERGISILPRLHPAYCERYPGVTLRITQNFVRPLETLTLQGYVDMCLLSLYKRQTRLDYEVLCQEELLLFIPQTHPLASRFADRRNKARPVVSLKDFAGESFVMTKSGTETRQIIDEMCAEAGVSLNILFESDSNYTVFDTASRIPALCFIPETVIHHLDPDRQNIYCSINRDKYSWNLVIAYRKGLYLNRASRAFITMLSSLLQDMNGMPIL